MKIDHIPTGDPCVVCGLPAFRHRIDHHFRGDNPYQCQACHWPLTMHRVRERIRVDHRVRTGRKQIRHKYYAGLDGEGQGKLTHRYVLLAASDETGNNRWYIENSGGLTTEQCLTFVFELPPRFRLFTFSFGYDLTKMLQDLDERALYYLFRPELRQRYGKEAFKGPYPVRWRNWVLNLQGTKFSVARLGPGQKKADVRSKVVWDIWKFYQSKYTKALRDWKVGTRQMVDHIQLMKDKRHLFDQEPPEKVREYCFNECQLMAQLAHRLDDAHRDAGLKLKTYYGAGSTATTILTVMDIKSSLAECPIEMREAVACGFSGGRFDHSTIGAVRRPIHGYDISSAYPYHAYLLPCLVHGQWSKTHRRKDIEGARLALVHYGLSDITQSALEDMAWGPFPFRTRNGSICYPGVSGGGWVWKDEYLVGERTFPNVYFREAWCYHTDCDCRPFQKISEYYLERLAIGKEGPGIVIKLGINSIYGKTAQSVGRGQFNSWIYAGNITSGCRAQVLEARALFKDPWSMTMVATDGIQSTEKVELPRPLDTGTNVEVIARDTGKPTRKPLGGWEYKPVDKGVFYARPGVYFPLDPTNEELDLVRGRGVGRGVILENWPRIVDAWEMWVRRNRHFGFPSAEKESDETRWPVVQVSNVSRFCGAKSSISRAKGEDGRWIYNRANGNHLDSEPCYGEWVNREVKMSFNPKPKRAGLDDTGQRLRVRHMGKEESAPYDKATISPEARELILQAQEMMEQPDADYTNYESFFE